MTTATSSPTITATTTSTLRGEQAKSQLIRAAIAQFGEHGRHATTRDIAAAAKQNISAIRYYFNGKDELYLACAQWIADFFREQFIPYTSHAEQLFSQPVIDKTVLRQLIHDACLHLLHLMTTDKTLNISRFLSREQLQPTAAYLLIHHQLIAPLQYYLVQAIAHYTGGCANNSDFILHTHALLGAILSFRLSRETLLLCTGWHNFDQQKIGQIEQVVSNHINFILQGLSQSEPPQLPPSQHRDQTYA